MRGLDAEVKRRRLEMWALVPLSLFFIVLNWALFRFHSVSAELPVSYAVFFFGLVNLNVLVFLAIIFFLGLGLVQVYSSSFIYATDRFGDGTYMFSRQLIFTLIATVVLLTTIFMPWNLFKKVGVYIWGLAVIGIALTYVPGLGVKVNGAQRWIRLFAGIRFEPSELLKITYPFLMATFIVQKPDWGKYSELLQALVVALPLALLLKQPDFGSVVLCTLIVIGLLFAFGMKWRYLALGVITTVPTAIYLVMNSGYRKARVLACLDPWGDPGEKGFQVIQSMLGFYSGGITGNGIGEGQAKLFFLPEAHTDFVFAVLAEELGLIGVFAVLVLFFILFVRAMKIGRVALLQSRAYSAYLAYGIGFWLTFQALINVGVTSGALPTKGLTLPFVSYGNNSLLVCGIAIAILLRIDFENKLVEEKLLSAKDTELESKGTNND